MTGTCLAWLQAIFPLLPTLSPLFSGMTILTSSDTQAPSENDNITGYSSYSLFFFFGGGTWAGMVKEGLCINVPFHLFISFLPLSMGSGYWPVMALITQSSINIDFPSAFPPLPPSQPMLLEWHLHLYLSVIISAGCSIWMLYNVQCIFQGATFVGLLCVSDVSTLRKTLLRSFWVIFFALKKSSGLFSYFISLNAEIIPWSYF